MLPLFIAIGGVECSIFFIWNKLEWIKCFYINFNGKNCFLIWIFAIWTAKKNELSLNQEVPLYIQKSLNFHEMHSWRGHGKQKQWKSNNTHTYSLVYIKKRMYTSFWLLDRVSPSHHRWQMFTKWHGWRWHQYHVYNSALLYIWCRCQLQLITPCQFYFSKSLLCMRVHSHEIHCAATHHQLRSCLHAN